MARVLLKDVAALAGTSPATVSKVLNDMPDSGIPEATAARVRSAAATLHYVPLASGRSLRRRRTDTVALIAHDLTPFTAEIVAGVEAAAAGSGLTTVLALHGGDSTLEAQHLRLGLRGQVDGMVVVPARGRRNLDVYESLSRHGVPVVFVDRYVPGYAAHYVGTRNEEAAYRLTRALIEQGARAIAGVAGPSEVTALEERWLGFRRALSEAGLPYDEGLYGERLHEGQRAWLLRVLAARPRVEGIFWSSYQYIQPHLQVLAAAGARVPADIRFTGFDPVSLSLSRLEDYQAIAAISGPWPVAIQPGYEMGRQALQIVLSVLGGQTYEEPRRVLLEPRYEWFTPCPPA
ncbi:MAG: LacI family DNA-binding transcriptional regulator [Anaerolineae bacterium]